MSNGAGCAKKCCKANGERFEIVHDPERNFLVCSCDVCNCQCRAMYHVGAVNDIKLGMICEAQKSSQFAHPLGNQSKFKSQFSVNESTEMLRERIGTNGKSTIDEAECEKLAHDLTKDAPRHRLFIGKVRNDILPQMTGGKATLIQTPGGMVNVRAAHNSKLINQHAYKNNLNPNVLARTESVGKPSDSVAASAVYTIDDEDEEDSAQIMKVVCNVDYENNSKEKASDENDVRILDNHVLAIDSETNSAGRKRSVSQTSLADEESVDCLYAEIRQYLFDNIMSGGDEATITDGMIYTHLAPGCATCKQVIRDLLNTGKGRTMQDALAAIDRFMPFHD
jgi:hypothetical protein